jgi:exodeoxyribonuclease V alpha subunit
MRQSGQSEIAASAKQIKAGVAPELAAPGQSKSDCYFIEASGVFEIQRLVINAATRSLPEKCGADPHREIQVLTPMRKGALGTINLNKLIRAALNRAASEPDSSDPPPDHDFRPHDFRPHDFRPNDRVLQTKNNYNVGVFNEECGIVEETAGETVVVRFDDRRVTYDRDSIADLTPGYAITIHRSQGSEYPFVIIPIHESQGIMLTRELLYTALTRGKRMVVLIGSRSAFAQAVTLARSHRLTGLKDLLTPPATVTPAKKAA